MKNGNYMLIGESVRRMKPDVTVEYMKDKYPDIRIETCKKPPTIKTMERWMNDCYARTMDGCKVEPDGECDHGYPSWPRALGFI